MTETKECFGCGGQFLTSELTEMDDNELYCSACLDFYDDDDDENEDDDDE